MADARLIIASNRLPFTVVEDEGKLELKASAGGLVTGLSAYLDSLQHSAFTELVEYVWLGWPGASIKDEHKDYIREIAASNFNAHPVFVREEAWRPFITASAQNDMALFHYFQVTSLRKGKLESYKVFNEYFCDAIMKCCAQMIYCWIHDYHLMLLPSMIRRKMPKLPSGFSFTFPFRLMSSFAFCTKNGHRGYWRAFGCRPDRIPYSPTTLNIF